MILGDSHLGLDLQFGVQEHAIMKALVHENYNIRNEYHYDDIGQFTLEDIGHSAPYRSGCAAKSC